MRDGRRLAVALVLGVGGALIGTHFYATQEAGGLPAAKEHIVAASGDRTVRGILFDIACRNVWPAPTCEPVLRIWRAVLCLLVKSQNTS